jgi:hypothetical protein
VPADPWTFADSPDLGVFTTRQLLREGAPLGLISHDSDGDWQFLHEVEVPDDEDPPERNIDDLLLVHVSHIVERFPQVLEYADLPLGWIAWPNEEGTAWVREPRPSEWDERE